METETSLPVFPLVEVATFPLAEMGRGIRAKESIKKGTRLVSMPIDRCFSVASARAALPEYCAPLNDTDVIAIQILLERSKGDHSSHAAHISTLPKSYDSAIFWTDEELAQLEGCACLTKAVQLRKQTKEDFALLVKQLVAVNTQGGASSILRVLNLEAYRWALATIWSRFMDFSLGVNQGTIRVGVPFMDMFNHKRGTAVNHRYDPDVEVVDVIAGKDLSIGEQVFINYGCEAGNEKFILFYGFVDEGNPADAVEIYVPPPNSTIQGVDDVLANLQAKVLKFLGSDVEGPIFKLTAIDPLPDCLLQALRIRQLSIEQLDELCKMEEIDCPESVEMAEKKLSDALRNLKIESEKKNKKKKRGGKKKKQNRKIHEAEEEVAACKATLATIHRSSTNFLDSALTRRIGKMIDSYNDQCVSDILVAALQSMLEAHTTTLKEDEVTLKEDDVAQQKMLEDPDEIEAMPMIMYRKRMAIALRVSEKRILMKTLDMLQE